VLHHRRPLLQALLVAAMLITGARRTRAERAVFESYVGNRPPEAERIMPFVRMVFDRRGFTVDPKVLATRLREHAYRPGISSPKAAALGELLKRQSLAGENYFASGNFADAATELEKLLATLRQNPLTLALTPKHRELAMRALVFYALAKGRQAQAPDMRPDDVAATLRVRDGTMDELVRSFPSKVISARAFGEEAERLFLEARDRLNKAGRGSISIAVTDPDAVIYLNEIVRGTTKVDIGDIVPGIYRVLVQAPTGEARQYDVEVAANQVARLTIDWEMDSLIHIGSWVGFPFPTEKEHTREALLIHQLMKNYAYAMLAATLTITRAHGHLAVIGTLYGVQKGRLLHSGIVELSGRPADDEKQLNLLVDCLMGISSGDGVQAVPHPEYTPIPDSEPVDVFAVARPVTASESAAPGEDVSPLPTPAAEPHEVSKWLVTTGATVSLSVAAVGLYMDDRDVKPIGYVALGAGAVLGGLAVYLFLDGSSDSRPSRITITPSRSELMAHWSTKF
jgi:hypothetical protein